MLSLRSCQTEPYGNWKVFDRDGHLMFRCSHDKAHWYLDRNLAEVIQPYNIRLLFQPNGPGHIGDDFYLQDRPNRCVVCGTNADLSKHHIVPSEYRQHFPESIKKHSSHDVVVLCLECHGRYELYASDLRKILAAEYDMPLHGKGKKLDQDLLHTKMAGNALQRHMKQMPPKRIEELLCILRKHYNRENITDEDINNAATIDPTIIGFIAHGKYVVEHTDNLQAFVERWRQHFLVTMQPKYMLLNWRWDRTITGVKSKEK